MSRPTQEQLDEALESADHYDGADHTRLRQVLAREVLALREELLAFADARCELVEQANTLCELRRELSELRAQRDLFIDANEAAELRIVELREELARIRQSI